MNVNWKFLAALTITLAVGFLIGDAVNLSERTNLPINSEAPTADAPQQDLKPPRVPPAIAFESQRASNYDTSRSCMAVSSVAFPQNGLGPFMKNPAFDMATFAKHAAEDPQKALEEGIALWEKGEGGKAYYVALCFWVHQDPSAAFQYTYSIENEMIRTDAQVQILSRKSQSDPKSVALAIRSLPSDSRFSRIARSTYENWAKQDIESAAISALEIPESHGRLPILLHITRQWLAADFESATRFIVSIDDSSLRQQLARQNSQVIIARDLRLAMAVAHDADADDKLLASTHFVRSVAQKDPDVVFDSIRSRYNPGEQRVLMDVFVKAVTVKGAALAAKYVDQLPTVERESFYEYVGRSWARYDPQATVAWLENAANPESRVALANIGPVVAYHDVRTAMSLTPRVPSELQFRWINSVTEELAANDPIEAYQWLRKFAMHERYSSIVELQGARILTSDVEAGVDLILLVPSVDKRSKLASIYIGYVAARKPATAALMLSATATTSTEQQMTNDLMREWVRLDSVNAKSWIRKLEDPTSRDMAILSYAKFSTDPPESMVLLCSEIENEHKRKVQIANLISAAQHDNIDKIISLLHETSLSEDEKLWYRAHARDVKKLRSRRVT